MNNQFYNTQHAPPAPAPHMGYNKPGYANSLQTGGGGGYGGGGQGLYGQQNQQGGMGGMFDQEGGGHAMGQGQSGPQGNAQGQGQGQGNGQQGMPAGPSNPNQSAPSAAAAAQQPEMTLPSILHFLQSEWRRWERERNEWEIERADLRSRIALLEGLKRSSENAAADQKRRIMLLEYALKAERAKALGNAGGSASSSGSPAQRATTNGIRKGTSLPDTSGPGDPQAAGSLADPGTAGAAPTTDAKEKVGAHGKTSSAGDREEQKPLSTSTSAASGWKTSVPFMTRDPKARARSRDYLKQCLQEISYLTSPAALNPLPARIPLSSGPSSNDGDHAYRLREQHDGLAVAVRPEKVLSEKPGVPADKAGEEGAAAEGRTVDGKTGSDSAQQANGAQSDDVESQSGKTLIDSENGDQGSKDGQQLMTAIYKPESKAAWKEALRSANEKAEQSRQDLENGHPHEFDHSDAGILAEDSQPEASDASSSSASRIWRPVRQLRSHLDSVNAVVFGPDGSVVSGSTDCTVKYWRMDVANLAGGKASTGASEPEPQATFRGHTSTVTAVAASLSRRKIYSASLDSAIRVWNCPAASADTYAAYDPESACASLVGHSDAVWALALVPSKKDAEGWLVSASADGTVKVWDATAKDGRDPPLHASWRYEADGDAQDSGQAELPVPICIAAQPSQLKNVLIGYTNGVIKSFELETGKEVMRYAPAQPEGDPAAANAVICHPTLDVIVAAYDDGLIRIFDVADGKESHSMTAHTSSVTSLALDASTSTQFASSGSDCSVKIWDLESRDCLQEWSLHRQKGEEGVQAVAFSVGSPGLPMLAGQGPNVLCSAGGDGIIRLYTKEKEVSGSPSQ